MKLNVYVIASDLKRSTEFYTALFGMPPILVTPGYVAFSLGGALYGLFEKASYPIPVQVGNNCTPNVLVENIEKEYDRVKALHPAFLGEIRQSGVYRLFVFTDPDGTGIEFYSEA